MKVTILLALAITSRSVYAGHHHYAEAVGKDIVVERTSPEAVQESERSKTCPHGFKEHGKQCIQIVTTKPTIHCPTGYFRSADEEHICAKHFEKVFECPTDFVHENGVCVRSRQIEPLVQCPHSFTLMSDGRQCSRNVPLPNKFFCPPGSVQRGEACFKKVPVTPEIACPPGFSLSEDKLCKIVETFDCTPAKVDSGKEATASHKHSKKLRLLGEKGKKHAVFLGKEVIPTEEEYIVQKTCKRVRTEGARRICPKGSLSHGKECLVEEEVPFYEKSGGFREEIVKASFLCPEGHIPSSMIGRFHCIIKEELPAHGFCPENSENIGNKCVKLKPLILRCPSSYNLEDGVCARTIVAPPIVEFNVKFRCVGKNCDDQLVGSKHHK